jgi:hypothetical protein
MRFAKNAKVKYVRATTKGGRFLKLKKKITRKKIIAPFGLLFFINSHQADK